MKKMILALCLAIAFTPAIAQTPAPAAKTDKHAGKYAGMSAEQKVKMRTDKLRDKLGLSTDQYTKMLAVNTELMKRKDALRASNEQDKKAFRELGAWRREQYAAILTPAQMEQLKAMKKDRKMHKGGKRAAVQEEGTMRMPAPSK